MTSLKDTAKKHSSTQIMNIADLETVSVDVDVKEEAECEFPYSYIEIEGNRYRVPKSVLNDLKTILEDNSKIEKIRVKKTGEGMNTNYTVIPIL